MGDRIRKKLCSTSKGGKGKENEKVDLNYRNDISVWIKMLVSDAFPVPEKTVSYCYYVKDFALIKRVNPDIQGTIISTIMIENEEYANIAIPPCKSICAPNPKDLRLVLDITKGLGKDVNIDELMRIFEAEYAKRPEEKGDSRDKCIVSLLHLKNAGLFAQSGRSSNVWRKTFFGKSGSHVKSY